MIVQIHEKMNEKYEVNSKISESYLGLAWKCFNKETQKICTIKQITGAFRNPESAQKAYREIKYLERLSHPNIIKILSYHGFPETKDIFIQVECIQEDLSQSINNKSLRQIHKNFIFYQVANAISYLHSHGLIHRDIKPSSILINQFCQAKLSDFGLIQDISSFDRESDLILPENLANKWYMAPQVIINKKKYGKQSDIWALGCILAELFLNKPIFEGKSSLDQLSKIFQVIGKPKKQELEQLQNKDYARIIESMIINERKSLREIFQAEEHEFLIDLLEKIFRFSPKQRITIRQILKHPFIKVFKEKSYDSFQEQSIKNVPFQSKSLSISYFRKLLLLEDKTYSFQQSNSSKTSLQQTPEKAQSYIQLYRRSSQEFFSNKAILKHSNILKSQNAWLNFKKNQKAQKMVKKIQTKSTLENQAQSKSDIYFQEFCSQLIVQNTNEVCKKSQVLNVIPETTTFIYQNAKENSNKMPSKKQKIPKFISDRKINKDPSKDSFQNLLSKTNSCKKFLQYKKADKNKHRNHFSIAELHNLIFNPLVSMLVKYSPNNE